MTSRLSRDARILFATRFLRLFAYGGLATVLLLHLAAAGMSERQAGLLLTAALLGDTAISLALTTAADRFGRRKTLLAGAVLMLLAGAVFAVTANPVILLLAAIVGVISPSGSEVGPFIAVEQASLAEVSLEADRTAILSWYNLTGSVGTALGSLAAGLAVKFLEASGLPAAEAYRSIVVAYGACGVVLGLLFLLLRRNVEPCAPAPTAPLFLGLHKSRAVVFRLSALFALDGFGGAFVLQAVVAYWFHVRHGVPEATLGAIFFGANLLAGLSGLVASRIAKRFGLINTMVFTHLPSNVLLILVPFMPTPALAVAVLLARFSLSQMDVPTRQAFMFSVVDADERSAAAGVTGVARTTGAALAPVFVGPLLASPALAGVPFFVAGALKIAYDLLLYRSFRRVHPPGLKA
ncbi:MAG: MFS transporter [Planctomycetota bacterium]